MKQNVRARAPVTATMADAGSGKQANQGIAFSKLKRDDPFGAPVIGSFELLCTSTTEQKKDLSHDDYPKIKALTENLWLQMEHFARELCRENSKILGESFRFAGLGSLKFLFQKAAKCKNISPQDQNHLAEFIGETGIANKYQRIVDCRNSTMHGDSIPRMNALDTALGFSMWLISFGVHAQGPAQKGNDQKKNNDAKPKEKQQQGNGKTENQNSPQKPKQGMKTPLILELMHRKTSQ